MVDPILEYENGKAVRVLFKSDWDAKQINVYHLNNADTPILGNFAKKEGQIIFTPAIPFSDGNQFGIARYGKQIAHFKVKTRAISKKPELLVIYPRMDTVPVNILKMYMVFSHPMQHIGSPLDFITVFDKTDNIEVHPFLDLETELWDKKHTRLTLWFDPGRIKTDLIPNKEKGLPLKQGHVYTITIDKNWKSATGFPLAQSYSKTLKIVGKDGKSPDLTNWKITAPLENTKSPLKIDFHDALDPVLALECIKLFKGDTPLSGNLKLSNTDKTILFEPNHFWKKGVYKLGVNPILEDLAGNNLKNLFDSDLKKIGTEKKTVTTLEFSVQ
ncbi:hypothetical protein [Croceitalea rosinachiae]|uniref:SbsA Ig-like domain-containing protein n=1 Tax=Croceitalea rosinachiae TaxID=3075596 RepID=A0ABU3ADX2_9FLAO|nr:hypothetical protein [Croceitalea sp. F388]MDT0607712.1 hypothetical protein [Croceitalea sp. F388]